MRMKSMASVVAAFALLEASGVEAQSVEDFYRGKQIRLLIGADTGAGFDTYARILAQYLGNFIPGKPTFVAQNMPGAGGIQAANYLYLTAPRDGSMIGALQRTMAQAPLVDTPGVQYDSRKFHWLGSLNNEVGVCVSWHESPVKTFKDVFDKELIVAATSNSDSDTYSQVLNRVLGTKLKIITGYTGGAQLLVALERRESDGRCGWSWSSVVVQRPDWLKEKKINVLAQMAVEKHPELPDVPLVTEFARTDDERKALRFVFARGIMGRPYVIPPGVPDDRVAALRAAFDAMVKDPGVIAEFARQKQELTPVSGLVIQKLVDEFYATPKDLIDLVK